MKKIYKVVIALLALLALGVISVFGVGFYSYYRYSSKNSAARDYGKEFGASTDQRGCVNESLRQFRAFKENNFWIRIEQMHIEKFSNGCLMSARPTKDFCDDVPRKASFVTNLKWGVDQCRKAGVDENGPCSGIYEQVIEACNRTKQETVSYPE